MRSFGRGRVAPFQRARRTDSAEVVAVGVDAVDQPKLSRPGTDKPHLAQLLQTSRIRVEVEGVSFRFRRKREHPAGLFAGDSALCLELTGQGRTVAVTAEVCIEQAAAVAVEGFAVDRAYVEGEETASDVRALISPAIGYCKSLLSLASWARLTL